MTENKAYELVIDYIKKGIINQTFLLGEKLPSERELAELLNVSRNSVREALRVLGIMGTIEPHQGAGNFVSDNFARSLVESMTMMYAMNRIDYDQIAEFRHALEARAFVLALENVTEEELAEMKLCLQKMDESSLDEEKVQFDKKFHYILVETAHNWIFTKNVEALNYVMDYFIRDMRSSILKSENGGDILRKSHWDIMTALEEKDEKKGLSALEIHFACIKRACTV